MDVSILCAAGTAGRWIILKKHGWRHGKHILWTCEHHESKRSYWHMQESYNWIHAVSNKCLHNYKRIQDCCTEMWCHAVTWITSSESFRWYLTYPFGPWRRYGRSAKVISACKALGPSVHTNSLCMFTYMCLACPSVLQGPEHPCGPGGPGGVERLR